MLNQQSVNLDLLRATAVTLVLVDHVIAAFHATGSPIVRYWGIQNLGTFGVAMFFIHTSLVLMMSLDRLAATGNSVIPRFYIRRAFRIYPLSLVTVAAILFLRIPPYFVQAFSMPSARTIWANLLLVQNLTGDLSVTGPLWSLPLEVQMYLLLPFLHMVASRVRSHVGALLLIAAGVVVGNLEARAAHRFGFPDFLAFSAWFCIGIAAYSVSRRARATLSPWLYCFVLIVFSLSPCITHKTFSGPRSGWMLFAMGTVFALGLPHFSDVSSPVVKIAAHNVATYSYGIYLTHVSILWFAFIRLAGQPLWLQITVCAVLMVAVPVALYHTIELPMIRLGGRIAGRLCQRKLTGVVTAGA